MSLQEPIVYLIRHATPDFNRPDLVYYLPPGPPLTPKGEQEARELAQFLKEAGTAGLFASPLERCLSTARVVSQATGLEIAIEPGLAEVRPGETESDLRGRVSPVWEKALAAGKRLKGPVALITHGAPVGLLLKDLGLPEETMAAFRRQFDHFNPVPPAGAWKAVRAPGCGTWRLDLAFIPTVEQIIL